MRPTIERWGDVHAGTVLINLHEDERSSIEAMRVLAEEWRVRAIRLVQHGTREVTVDGVTVDPNRMFSGERSAGIVTFSEEVIATLRDAQLIIAVHNNKGEDYTAESYLHDLAGDAAAVHLSPGMPASDFFIVTQREDFDRFVAAGHNVILQARDCVDDGSLSVWAQRSGKRYINVETLRGHTDEQVAMLRTIRSSLPSRAR